MLARERERVRATQNVLIPTEFLKKTRKKNV